MNRILTSATRQPCPCSLLILEPEDPAGVTIIYPVLVTPDGKTFVYGFRRILSGLYMAEGLK